MHIYLHMHIYISICLQTHIHGIVGVLSGVAARTCSRLLAMCVCVCVCEREREREREREFDQWHGLRDSRLSYEKKRQIFSIYFFFYLYCYVKSSLIIFIYVFLLCGLVKYF